MTATAAQLRSGAPVQATLCEGPFPVPNETLNPIPLPEGRQDVVVDPGAAFFVDGMRLRTMPVPAAGSTSSAPRAADTTAWDADHREIIVDEKDTDQLLVVPESNNIGWHATTSDGDALVAVTVDGWQQGWIVPAGTSGTITLDFPSDTWYRLGIFGGLFLLIPLAFFAFRRSRVSRDAPPSPWGSRFLALVLSAGALTIVAGVTGLITGVVVGAAAWSIRRRFGPTVAARTVVATSGIGTILAMALLSKGPWRAADGYVGHSYLVQFSALVGLTALAVSVCAFTDRGPNRRRIGSSTSA